MKKLILPMLLTFATHSALAEVAGEIATTTPAIQKAPTHPLMITLNGVAVLLNGVGIKAAVGVTDGFSVGVLGSMQKLKSEADISSTYKYEHRMETIGVIAEYFANGTTGKGAFASLALTNTKVNTSTKDSVLTSLTNSSSASQSGYQAKIGYQMSEKLFGKTPMLLQFAVGYGNGGSVKWSMNGTKTEIADAILLDANIGTYF